MSEINNVIEFRNAAGHAGINTDNLKIEKVVLRDEKGNDIDSLAVKNW